MSEAPQIAAAPDLEDLIVSGPLVGYSLSSDPTALSGAYTMDELFFEVQQDPGDDLEELKSFHAYARTWDGPEADRLFVVLVEAPSDFAAAKFVAGASDEAAWGESALHFETLIPGTAGLLAEVDGTIVHAVIWQQGKYAVQVVSGSLDSATGERDVLEVARQQVALLQESLGFGVTMRSPAEEESSLAYRLGGITFYVIALGGIVGIVLLIFKSRSKKGQVEAEWSSAALGGYAPPSAAFPSSASISSGPRAVPPPPPPYSSE